MGGVSGLEKLIGRKNYELLADVLFKTVSELEGEKVILVKPVSRMVTEVWEFFGKVRVDAICNDLWKIRNRAGKNFLIGYSLVDDKHSHLKIPKADIFLIGIDSNKVFDFQRGEDLERYFNRYAYYYSESFLEAAFNGTWKCAVNNEWKKFASYMPSSEKIWDYLIVEPEKDKKYLLGGDYLFKPFFPCYKNELSVVIAEAIIKFIQDL